MPDLSTGRLRRRILALFLLGGLSAAAYAALRPAEPAEDPIQVDTAARRSLVKVIAISGHLDVKRRVEVPSPGSGRLVSIDVDTGQTVTAGQILAHLDEPRADLAMGSAQAQLGAASSRLTAARVALGAAEAEQARLHTLVARGLASEADLAAAQVRVDQARATLDVARADQAAATTNVASARLGRDYGVLRAPIDGVVLDAPRNVGGIIGPGGPLFVLGSGLDVLRIDASVGEADVGEIRLGQTATFEVPAYLGRTFTATVVHIGPDADVQPGATTYPVRFEAPNPDGLLRSGMTAMLRIEVARVENSLSVPEAALRFTPDGAPPAPPRSRVWRRVGPSQLEPVTVVAGVSDGAFTEVRPTAGELPEGAEVAVGVRLTERGGRAGISLGAGSRRANSP